MLDSKPFRFIVPLLTGILVAGPFSAAHAQNSRSAKLTVTVVDPTGGVLPGATVTLVGLEAATKDSTAVPAKTTDKGVATIEGVTPGRYSITAEFSGFDLGLVRDVRLNPGENKRVVVLPFKNLQESVTVGSGQEGAASRTNTAAFGLALTTEQIEALSDDRDELQKQLTDLGGPDAVIRIDSFEGQQLPPKSQIKSIHVTRDQFAAETEQPGATFVDVITQAGVGQLRGSANYSYRDGRMDGQNPFLSTGTRTPATINNYGINISNALAKDKADFAISINGSRNYANPILNANALTGAPAQVLARQQGNEYRSVNGLFNYALSRDQTLRLSITRQDSQYVGGFGGYDALERGLTYKYGSTGFRVMEAGPIGRRIFLNTRLSVNVDTEQQFSATEAPTIVILGTTTTGGAQVAGATHSRNVTLESDLDYVRGIHSWRAGVKIVGGSFRTDERSNYLGTYTFSSVDDYLAGRPSVYSISTGNPAFSYVNVQGAVYLQDDIRVSKGLTLSPGLRYSAQQRIHDPGAFEPRLGITWAPFPNGRTTVRVSGGSFHGWLAPYIIAQSIRFDGTHGQEVNITDPSYPNAGPVASAPATKYQIGNYQLNQNVRYSAGIDQVLSPKVRVSVIYSYWHMRQLPRGEDLNPLVNGVRPDPRFKSVIATVTDSEIRRHDVNATFNINLAAGAPASTDRFNLRRLTINGGYTAQLPKRNAIGPFDVPPTGNLADEWGNGPASIRYGVNANITSTQLRNLTVNMNVQVVDGQVYMETTGRDDNGDGFFNDRPAGVGVWTLRGDGRETVNLRVTYAWALGGGTAAQPRYRVTPFLQINNLTNHANYTGYNGIVSSGDRFKQPTNVVNPRQITSGFNVSF